MAKEIKIPQIAEGVESATVTEILVKKGDTIEKDQGIIAVESDKASVEIPSPESGKVKSVSVSEGDEVEVGDVILELEADDSEEEDAKKDSSEEKKKKSKKDKKDSSEESEENSKKEQDSKDEEEESSEDKKGNKEESEKDSDSSEEESEDDDESEKSEDKEEKSKKDKKQDSEKNDSQDDEGESNKDSQKEISNAEGVPAAPGVRRLARELGVNIQKVKGSGEKGRISKQDVKDHDKGSKSKVDASLSLPDFSEWGETERKSLSGIRKATAKNTSAAWSNIPHVFQFDEADISDIEERMEKLQEKAEGNLTITAILAKISASALRQFPKFNASIDMETEEMILKKYVNIGIAVDTEKGLLVPVIRNVDQKTIIEISKEITDLAEKARNGKLSAEEMKGGNFTISNLGGIGGTNFTPIVYHPQVAILGVSRAKTQPVYIDDNFEPRDILPLSLSYDHRIIDGAEGVRFLHWISRALEDPYEALLGA